jgi:hypothetical protein
MAKTSYTCAPNCANAAAYEAALTSLLLCLPDDEAAGRLFDVLEPQGATPEPIIPELLALWRVAGAAFNAAAKQPMAGNFDTPDCLAWQGIETALSDELRKATPTTKEEARALLQYALEDDGGKGVEVTIPRSVIDNLTRWLEV